MVYYASLHPDLMAMATLSSRQSRIRRNANWSCFANKSDDHSELGRADQQGAFGSPGVRPDAAFPPSRDSGTVPVAG